MTVPWVMHMPLIRDRELASPAFIRDLNLFFSQSTDVLKTMSDIGDSPDGFVGQQQAQRLRSEFNVPVGQALNCFRIAAYLYNRVSELHMDVDEAVRELIAIAGGLEPAVPIDEQKQSAMAEMLSFKREYEVASAISKATSDAPHFTSLNGTWAVTPVTIRNGDTVRVPVIYLTIGWHDGGGNHHEAFVHMTREDWTEFFSEVQAISDRFNDVERLL